MKTWNNAEIVELDVAATANGIFDSCIEVWPVLDKDDKKPVTPADDPKDKDKDKEKTDSLS